MNIGHLIYLVALTVFICGLYIMLTSTNNIRKIIGLSIFQNSILIFYIAKKYVFLKKKKNLSRFSTEKVFKKNLVVF